MKKTNTQLFSLVAIAINSPINVSPEDSETSENPKEAKNAEEPENPVNPSAPDTPNATSPDQNKKPGDEKPDPHKSFPYDDACASLLAYSICMESWKLALQEKRQKAKTWMSSIFSIVVLLSFITAILLFTFKFFESINRIFIAIAIIGGVILFIMIAYYIFECINRKQWFKYNAEMLKQLSEERTNLIECSPKSQERMTNLINQYRCDKWMEGKKKKTFWGIIGQKFMSIFPFSIS